MELGFLLLDVSLVVVGGGGEVEAVVLVFLEGGLVGIEGVDEEADVASFHVVFVSILAAIDLAVSIVSVPIIPVPIASIVFSVPIVVSITT